MAITLKTQNDVFDHNDYNAIANTLNSIQQQITTLGTSGGGNAIIATVATKAAANAAPLMEGQQIKVTVDESNNNDSSMYLYSGGGLVFLYTIIPSQIA